MVVNFKNYSLELVNGSNFNLSEIVNVFKTKKIDGKMVKTEDLVEKEIKHGYSLPFEKCVELIINLEISNKHDVLDIKNYIKQYKAVKAEVLAVLK